MIKLSLKQAQVVLDMLNDLEEKNDILPHEEQLQAYLTTAIDAEKDKN